MIRSGTKTDVTVVVGAGGIAQAIARRVSSGRHILVANHTQASADAAAKVLEAAGFAVTAMQADISDRAAIQAVVHEAQALGPIQALVQAAGVSPSQASIESILAVDLYGTAVLLEEFAEVMAEGESGLVISSQSSYRMPALTAAQDALLATAPAEDLLELDFVKGVRDTLHAYQMSKRCNSLRVRGEAIRWAKRGGTHQLDQPRHHRDAAGPRRAVRRARRFLPGDAGEDARRTCRHAGRGRGAGCAGHGPGRRLHHRQRFPDRRRCDCPLLLRSEDRTVMRMRSCASR